MAAAVIDFDLHYDRRATHRVVSDVSCFDRIMDVDALSQEVIGLCHNAHFQALGTGNESLVRTIQYIGGKVVHIRRIAQEGAALLDESMVVDPYLAAKFAHPDDAA
jgi:hypothetical protein